MRDDNNIDRTDIRHGLAVVGVVLAQRQTAIRGHINGTDELKVEDIVIKGKATVLPEAVNGVVTLTQDVELAEKVVVNAGETVTVNLNGNDITAASRAFNVNGGELVLTGELMTMSSTLSTVSLPVTKLPLL